MAKRLGELLVENGVITPSQLEEALEIQKEKGGMLASILLELGYADRETLGKYLSELMHIEFVDVTKIEIDDATLNAIPAEVAMKYSVLPIKRRGNILKVAMLTPLDVNVLDNLKFSSGFEIDSMVAIESDLLEKVKHYYKSASQLAEILENDEIDISEEDVEVIDSREEEEEDSELAIISESAPVVKLVNKVLMTAIENRAADIHIEPYEKDTRVRYRIDGILHEVDKPPKRLHKAVVQRIKILSNMNITEKRRPQDGRIRLKYKGRPIDFRVSVVPTMFGEKVAIRILDREAISFDLGALGFNDEMKKVIRRNIHKPHGIILVTGPTGSGKTTTLYAMLDEINDVGINITTAEDPIEYTIEGINQLQVRESIGLTFASALRAYLRQDPNVIMVGEIRDKETAEIAIRASLTGHLVLSTMHTNGAAATVTRIVNMGIEPFLVASTLNLVISQRLIRKICKNCKYEVEIDPNVLKAASIDPDSLKGIKFYKGRGCKVCMNTGYKGMVGIFEILQVTSKIREAILERKSTDELQEIAIKEGMLSLRQAAVEKLKEGVTDIENVIKETSIR
ncbi:type II secretion system protein GspE [candidate division TA06 bacterium]|uniref:Type II secretion system protein GspE n=1 Tax=candidate division TA06 bacterium TaxID=2250710 RepID=A0A660S7G1_UNCT6|nr:MAG: type II secretion system protein GspE [candidate division TA06 bacterium]